MGQLGVRSELGAVLGGERFLTEMKTTGRLQHSHILPLPDCGEADRGLFFVMPSDADWSRGRRFTGSSSANGTAYR